MVFGEVMFRERGGRVGGGGGNDIGEKWARADIGDLKVMLRRCNMLVGTRSHAALSATLDGTE